MELDTLLELHTEIITLLKRGEYAILEIDIDIAKQSSFRTEQAMRIIRNMLQENLDECERELIDHVTHMVKLRQIAHRLRKLFPSECNGY